MIECLLFTVAKGHCRTSGNCFYFREVTLEKFARGFWSASSHKVPDTRRTDFLQIVLHMTPWCLNPFFALSHIWKLFFFMANYSRTTSQTSGLLKIVKCIFLSLEHPIWALLLSQSYLLFFKYKDHFIK